MQTTMYRLLFCTAILFYSSVDGKRIDWDYNPSTDDSITPRLVKTLIADLSKGTLVFNILCSKPLLEALQKYFRSQVAIKLTTNGAGRNLEDDNATLRKIRIDFISHVYQIIWELLLFSPEDATLPATLKQAPLDSDPNKEEAASKMLMGRIDCIASRNSDDLARALSMELVTIEKNALACPATYNKRFYLCMLSHVILLAERASLDIFLCGKNASMELIQNHATLCSSLFPEYFAQYRNAIDLYTDLAEHHISVTERTFQKLSSITFNHIQDLIFYLFTTIKHNDLSSLTAQCSECTFLTPSSFINYDISYTKELCMFCKDAEPRKHIDDVDKPTIPPFLWGTMYS